MSHIDNGWKDNLTIKKEGGDDDMEDEEDEEDEYGLMNNTRSCKYFVPFVVISRIK